MLIVRHHRVPELFARLGSALRQVHDHGWLPASCSLPFSAVKDGGENVFVHGDLSLFNVGTANRGSQLLLVDWSSAPIFEHAFTYGPRLLDLVWFSFTTFYEFPPARFFGSDPGELIGKTLRAYLAGGGRWLGGFERLASALSRTFRLLQEQRAGRTAWSRRPFQRVYQRVVWTRWSHFVGNVSNC
jgi:aminoglycoside phosphotransferase (APT) family kinase protein